MGITMTMEVSEALIVLGALQDKQLAASRLAAISEGEEREIADLASKILRRAAGQLIDALYPDQCRWPDNEECDNPIERDGFCARHNAHKARIAEIMA